MKRLVSRQEFAPKARKIILYLAYEGAYDPTVALDAAVEDLRRKGYSLDAKELFRAASEAAHEAECKFQNNGEYQARPHLELQFEQLAKARNALADDEIIVLITSRYQDDLSRIKLHVYDQRTRKLVLGGSIHENRRATQYPPPAGYRYSGLHPPTKYHEEAIDCVVRGVKKVLSIFPDTEGSYPAIEPEPPYISEYQYVLPPGSVGVQFVQTPVNHRAEQPSYVIYE